ncbi:hypothetical protein WCD74_01165 [Actinomycetospora sp. OC33-EN08]|uniref:WXG100 family type VII secretion target n=1 Tax=Actinomycetospora aurantiaca TaxID=3129233 RepID=A0ABU8MHC5_9PSEU
MPIDTHVEADEAACSETSRRLDAVATAGEQSATQVAAARNASNDCWTGEAGEAFRDRMTALGQGGDTVAEQARAGSRALADFSAAVSAVRATMTQARADAAAAGLPVTGDVIGDPVPAPLGPPVPGREAAQLQAEAAAADQRAAFERAQVTVRDARTRLEEAEDRLDAALIAPTAAVRTFKEVVLVASSVTASLGGLHGAALAWREVAERQARVAATWQTLTLFPDQVPLRTSVGGFLDATRAQQRAAGIAGSNDAWLRGLTGGLSETRPGQAALGGVVRHAADDVGFLSRAQPVLSRVPYLSGAFVGVGIGADVATGRSVESSVAKNVTSFAAGAGTTALVGLAIAGGPATLLAIGAGIAVSYAIGANWDWIEDTAEDAADAVTGS